MDPHEASHIPSQSEPIRVFLSYSRRDALFLHRLAEALDGAGYAVDFDQSERDTRGLEFGISAQGQWWLRLKEMIAAADVMVFVVSPASIASRVCDDEIAYATSLGKRVIPVLRQLVDWDRAPERLRALKSSALRARRTRSGSTFETARLRSRANAGVLPPEDNDRADEHRYDLSLGAAG